MSAPADSVMSGGNIVSGDSEPVGQPADAVPMKPVTASNTPSVDGTTSPKNTAEPTPGLVDDAEPGTINAPASPKGKENVENSTSPPTPPTKERSDSMAIGPSVDDIKAVTPGAPDAGPVCNITLLLTSGGRHPYKIDARYLSRRSVAIPEETDAGLPDPFSISIYTLKELILREWRSDWESKPASPSSIRLIHFGKLLDDKEPLRKYQFSTESPNVVHMSIRPQDLDEEEPRSGNKNAGSGGADGNGSGSSRCCVIL